jgi:hypothetical protein
MPTAKKYPQKILENKLAKKKLTEELPQIQLIQTYEYGTDACFNAMLDDIPYIFEDEYDQLLEFLNTGEATTEFKDGFDEAIDEQWDSCGPYLHIERFTEEEFANVDLNRDIVFERTNWDDRCGDDLKDVNNTPFGYNTWKWGKLRFLISGLQVEKCHCNN